MKKTVIASTATILLALVSGCGTVQTTSSNTSSSNTASVAMNASQQKINETTTYQTDFQNDNQYYPIVLPNTITVNMVNYEMGQVPILTQQGRTIWDARKAGVVSSGGSTDVTCTSSGDTFFSYESASVDGGSSQVVLLGIHPNRKIFLNKRFSGVTQNSFLNPSEWQVYFSVPNPNYDPNTDPESDKYSNQYQVKEYSLDGSGHMKLIKSFTASNTTE